MKKRFLSLLCVLALCLGLLPVTALAAEGAPSSLYVGNQQVISGNDITYWTTGTDGKLTASNESGNWNVKYDPSTVTLSLQNAKISGGNATTSPPYGAGIYALSSSGQPVALTIELIGENTITGTFGIYVNATPPTTPGTDASLVIKKSGDNGSLTVTGTDSYGLYIASGTGNASLTIKNVSVVANATSSYSGSGVCVQSGASATDSPNISLSVDGGSLTASGTGSRDGILFYVGSSQATGATTSLTVSENAIVDARNGGISALKISETLPTPTPTGNNSSGIVFDDKNGTVYGSVALQDDLTIGAGETLTIGDGASLTVPDGKTLTNNGTVTVEEGGTLTNNGSLDCNHHTGGTATCTEKAKCDLCGAEYGDFLPHSLTKTEAKAPTCTVVGNEAYWTCGNCGKYFSDGNGNTEIIKDSWIISAINHDWNDAVYTWSDDGSTCTATRTCKNDSAHTEKATATVTGAQTKAPTCTQMGETTYTAAFEASWAMTQTKVLADIPAIGHSYGEPVWSWSEDGKTCKVTFTCEKDETHKETPVVKVTSAVKKPATCTETGVTTYTATVEFNGQTYTDTKDLTDIPATGHSYDNGKCTVCGAIASDFKVIITAGANGSWQKGTKDGLTFTSNAAYKHFQKVQVDGKDLDASNYTVKEGSTIVNLKTEYLETLSVGKHTLAIVSETGTATTEFTVKAAAVTDDTQSPQTGDDSNIALWIAVLLAAGTALTGTAVYSRKRKYSK